MLWPLIGLQKPSVVTLVLQADLQDFLCRCCCLNVRVAHLPVVDWARELRRPPTASPVILGTGVLWVSTGTHPCGSPSRQDDGETRAPASHTLDDVLRFRGDEEYRAVLLHPSSTCSCLRSGRSWEHHFVVDCVVCCVRSAGFLSRC